MIALIYDGEGRLVRPIANVDSFFLKEYQRAHGGYFEVRRVREYVCAEIRPMHTLSVVAKRREDIRLYSIFLIDSDGDEEIFKEVRSKDQAITACRKLNLKWSIKPCPN